MGIPDWAFFVVKYFGSGVIIATAFIHVSEASIIYELDVHDTDSMQLLAPAGDALRNPCLTGPITDYSWVEGIVLMTIFVLFFTELMAMRYATFGPDPEPGHHDHEINGESMALSATSTSKNGHTPGDDHFSHSRRHSDPEAEISRVRPVEDYAAQMTAIFILEFGVIFHSIFIGLTLAVAGPEFNTLYVVLVFHQTFEGLGLGSRLAVTPWPKTKRWTPYTLAAAYSLSTPIALAVGLGVRETYLPGSQTALIINGVFDSISAGILIYTGLVELMAHEFMFSEVMRRARLTVVLSAFAMMCLGAGERPRSLTRSKLMVDRTDGFAR